MRLRPNDYARKRLSLHSENSPVRKEFELAIAAATFPVNGQLPRPWMTDLADPLSAEVFIVGRNPAREYDASIISHERHVDALFNRNGQSCRGLYDELTDGSSDTRKNIDLLHGLLALQGCTRIIETNVICYSSPMSSDLARAEHAGGAGAGRAVFRLLLDSVRPRVVIAHGVRTIKDLGAMLGVTLPRAAAQPGPPVSVEINGMLIIVIPSLAPPAWRRWQRWAVPHLDATANLTGHTLHHSEG